MGTAAGGGFRLAIDPRTRAALDLECAIFDAREAVRQALELASRARADAWDAACLEAGGDGAALEDVEATEAGSLHALVGALATVLEAAERRLADARGGLDALDGSLEGGRR